MRRERRFVFKRLPGPMTEFPITTFRLAGHNMPVGGGGYLRLLPRLYTRLGLKRVQKEGLPIVIYIHPWEIDPGTAAIAGASELASPPLHQSVAHSRPF